jgi:predicted Zn-dependent protease
MMNTNEDLGKRIEQLVAEHIAATRKVAREAVERALAASGVAPSVSAQPTRARTAGNGKRRGAAELMALGERFYRVLCSKPGETMSVLAADVGATPRELHRAVAGLKEAGRVRSVGERSKTVYCPLANSSAA